MYILLGVFYIILLVFFFNKVQLCILYLATCFPALQYYLQTLCHDLKNLRIRRQVESQRESDMLGVDLMCKFVPVSRLVD